MVRPSVAIALPAVAVLCASMPHPPLSVLPRDSRRRLPHFQQHAKRRKFKPSRPHS